MEPLAQTLVLKEGLGQCGHSEQSEDPNAPEPPGTGIGGGIAHTGGQGMEPEPYSGMSCTCGYLSFTPTTSVVAPWKRLRCSCSSVESRWRSWFSFSFDSTGAWHVLCMCAGVFHNVRPFYPQTS